MPDDEHDFLAQGIVHYLEARQAVAAFDDAILTRLDRYTRGRRRWSPLEDVAFERSQIAGGSDSGWWISAGVHGRTQRFPSVRIDMGLWFGVHEHPSPIV